MAWEGIDSTVVTLRYLCGNEPATFSGTFHEDDGIRYPCHNPVAAHEVGFVGIRLCHELRQQSAMPYHLSGRLTVAVGIDMIQTVRQDTHRLIAVLQSLSMGMDIHTVCQSADNQHLRTLLPQIRDETADQILTVWRALPRPYDTDDLRLVQVAITYIIQDDGGIGALQ